MVYFLGEKEAAERLLQKARARGRIAWAGARILCLLRLESNRLKEAKAVLESSSELGSPTEVAYLGSLIAKAEGSQEAEHEQADEGAKNGLQVAADQRVPDKGQRRDLGDDRQSETKPTYRWGRLG